MDVLKAICMFGVLTLVAGHGRLIVPAARNCMWRFGFPNPKNYDDAGLYCGGFDRQWHKNKGMNMKCCTCASAIVARGTVKVSAIKLYTSPLYRFFYKELTEICSVYEKENVMCPL